MWRQWCYLFSVISLVAFLLVGCDLPRPAEADGDIDAFVPPPEVAAQVSPAAVEFQTGDTVVRLQPATQQLEVGTMGNVQIVVDNVTNLMGFEIELQFAPNIIQIQDVDSDQEGIQIQPSDFLKPDFVESNMVDNTTGNISYVVVQVPPTPSVSGSGVLATITFQAVAPGSTDLTLSTVKLADSEARPISATIQPGQVTVNGEPGQPTATFTPTSTPIPGQPTPTFTPVPGEETPTPTFTPIEPTATPTPTPTSPPSTITPIPPVTDIPPGATVGFCYRVQEGDTLHSLAQEFGVEAQCISLLNELHPPGYIFTHQALFIPTSNQYGYGPKVYIVESGDTLNSIAEQCHLPVSFLAFVNDLAEDAILQPGHVVEIPLPPFAPPSRFPHPPPGAPSVYPPPGPFPPAPPGRCGYIVKPGDTLYSISRRYGISVYALARANGLSNPNYIYVGQCLVLP